ncbi:MAG: lytic transglycosylase domain-containing protein [Bacteroidota bacterium]
MQKSLAAYTLALAAFLTIAVFASSTQNDSETTTRQSLLSAAESDIQQVIKPVNLDKDFSFAGETFPMDNFDVLERLDRELSRNTYWHSNTLLNIKKANKYFPVIERILAEHDVPDDFKYLAVAESDLRNAVSPAGAKGFWQFLKGTGKQYGLESNSQVDERYHLEKSTVAFTKYIKSLKNRFGSWLLAAAAYNMGGARLAKEIKLQHAENYFDLNLNQETSRYVFRLVAIKEIINNPQDFGFYIEQKDKYQPIEDYYEVKVNGAVSNWGAFAKKYGISYRMLKVYNPWLISTSLTNNARKTYVIKIPKN